MTPERWRAITEIFHGAIGREAALRAAFLAEACKHDASLKSEVEAMLAAHDAAGSFGAETFAPLATKQLAPGTRLGVYRIETLVGAGGMGEVYRARDTKLQRDVAIKVLPEAFARDTERLARFEREARTLASLNHPNIAQIYGFEESDGIKALVMELVEGPTLADRIAHGAVPLDEALRIATQIADALEAAHDRGVIHRDLKSANVKLRRDGTVKVLDFGLAKRPSGTDARDPRVDLLTDSGLTGDGVILGTVGYMSPEQAAGRATVFASDQFSFGVILFELLTGRRPFARDTSVETLSAIIRDDPPPIGAINPAVPDSLQRLVERCLAKQPQHRYSDTRQIAVELGRIRAREGPPEDTRDLPAPSMPPPAPVRLGPAAWRGAATGLALVAVAGAIIVFSYASRSDAPIPSEIRLEAVPITSYTGSETEPTLSPDGSQVAFTWDGENRDNHDIYVKAIGSAQPHRLTTDPARDGSPAWSPDGTRIAFLREKPGGGSEVHLISPTGGSEVLLSEIQAAAHLGLSWSPDGRSLAVVDRLSPDKHFAVFVLDARSGAKRRLAYPPSIVGDLLPAFSPDGRTVAFNRTIEARGPFVHTVPAEGGEPKMLVPTRFPRGRLAWIPGGKEILFAAVPVTENGAQPRPAAQGRATPSLWRVAVDSGQARPLAGTENAVHVAVSGHRLVYSQETSDLDIWRLDLRRAPVTGDAPIRFSPSTKVDANPHFSPDGERVAFTSQRSGETAIWVVDAQGRQPGQVTGKDIVVNGAPRWSPNGKAIAFDGSQPKGDPDIYVVSASGGPARRVTTSAAIDAAPSWSRDGQWIYFPSNRNGSWHVWKVPSSGEEAGNAQQVTRRPGFGTAIESTDGKHVYFSRIMPGSDLQSSIWRIPVEGGDEEVVVETHRSSATSWDLTAEGLYFLHQERSSSGTSWVVRFQSFDRRPETEVARLRLPPFLGGPAISVSPDGRWLLSTQRQEDSDLMLVESFR
jgi:serine/threonine protein kinase